MDGSVYVVSYPCFNCGSDIPKAQVDLHKCADSPLHLLLAIPQRLWWTWVNVQTPQSICCSLFPKGSGGPVQMCSLPRAFAARYSPKAQVDLCKCAVSPEHFLLAIPQRLRWICANVQTPQSICCSLFPKGSGGPGQMGRLPRAFAARYSPKAQVDLCKCAVSPEHLLLAILQRLRWTCGNVQTPQSICCSLFSRGSGGPVEMCRLPRAFAARYSPEAQVDLWKCTDSPEHLLLALGGPVQMCRLPREFAAC